jgi:hypothetical protein
MSSGIPTGLPVTYITDPGVTGVGTTIVAGGTITEVAFVADGTMAVRNTGQPITVFIAGGTSTAEVIFTGTISTDIGQVELEDASGNQAVMPSAQDSKNGGTKALVVQHIDPTGAPLYQGTQLQMMNSFGTLATDATALLQATNGSIANARLASIDVSVVRTDQAVTAVLPVLMNNQGTLATSTGQASALTAQQTGNATATAIMNYQGTQSTTALALETTQTTGNAILTAILNTQGTQAADSSVAALVNSLNGSVATAPNQVTAIVKGSISNSLLNSIVTLLSGTTPTMDTTLFNAATGTGASAAVDVSRYNRHTVQHIVSNGTVNLQFRTSLDGIHWHVEDVARGDEVFTLTGHTKYVSANFVNGSSGVVVTTLLRCGQPDVGSVVGGSSSSSGTTNLYGGFSSALSQTIGATYEVNVDGYNGVGFHIVPPTGGQIDFEGSYDGINWAAITLREIGANGYTQKSIVSEDYIGSVACLTKIRFRTSVGGSAPGSIGGRFTVPSNTLEGIEHGNPPHLIGYPCVVKSVFSSGSAYNKPVWVPAAGKRAVVTDVHLSVDATAVITLSDGAVSLNDWIIYSSLKVAGGDSKIISENFRTPHVTHQSGGTVYITQTAGSVTGVLHGYEIPA